MHEKTHDYQNDEIVVRYRLSRCIHAAACVRGLPHVFDPNRKPWVDASAADGDAIAEVVMRCPTGALHFERLDGGPAETPDETNTVLPTPRGPLYVRGDLEIRDASGAVTLRDTRVALCRCGQSANKPFCDGSHWNARFADDGRVAENKLTGEFGAGGGPLVITATENGPLRIEGPLELWSSDANATHRGARGTLCRCGQSATKPYCDGNHTRVGFVGDARK